MSLPEYIVNLINGIAKRKQFTEHRIELSDAASKRGEHFTGELTFLQLIGTRNVDEKYSLDLVIKTAPTSTNRRQVFQAITGFKCEVEMYTKVLPAFIAFQEQKHLPTMDRFLAFPEVFATVYDEEKDQFAIIMEDLRRKNYKISRRSDSTSYEHARLVMAELAKFHAISFAMRDQKRDIFLEIVRNETLSSRYMKDDLGYEIINVFNRSLIALEDEKHKELIKI